MVKVLFFFQLFFSKRELTSDSQGTRLESGFESLLQAIVLRSSFFILAVLFVLFDVELILLFPFLMFFYLVSSINSIIILIILRIIIISLIIEWFWCGLKWYS